MRAGNRERVSRTPLDRIPRYSGGTALPKCISPTERSVAHTKRAGGKIPGERGRPPDVRQADLPAGLGAPRAAEETPVTSPGEERSDVGTSSGHDTFVGHPRAIHLTVDPYRGESVRRENVPSEAPRRPSARTPETRAGPTESSSVPALNLGTSHPIGPRRAANRASTVPFTSPGLSRRRRRRPGRSRSLHPPSIPSRFLRRRSPRHGTCRRRTFLARAFQRSADPALRLPFRPQGPQRDPTDLDARGLEPSVASTFPPRRGSSRPLPFPSIPAR